jgi:hypothetical protein
MYNTIKSILKSITSQEASVVGCNLTVQTPNGELVSIKVEPVQSDPIKAWKEQFKAYQSQRPEFPQFRCRKCGNSGHTVRGVHPECAKYSELTFNVLRMLFDTCSIQGIEQFFQVSQSYEQRIQDILPGMFSYTRPKIHSRILMILILKLYESLLCTEHNPHLYFFVLKPLFQVNQKNLRNEYSERITSLVQYIASIEFDLIEPLVNLIFKFGKYVGKDVFVQTLREIRHYQGNRRSTSHIFNKEISMFIVEFFKNNPETNQEAISEFGKPLNIW